MPDIAATTEVVLAQAARKSFMKSPSTLPLENSYRMQTITVKEARLVATTIKMGSLQGLAKNAIYDTLR